MITKIFGKDFHSDDGALTLPGSAVGSRQNVWKIHSSGWAIRGDIQDDWATWVNYFEATHARFGKVWGDFESEVFADTEAGFSNFFDNHPPDAWDYQDI